VRHQLGVMIVVIVYVAVIHAEDTAVFNCMWYASDVCRESLFGSILMCLVTYQEQTLKLVSLIALPLSFWN